MKDFIIDYQSVVIYLLNQFCRTWDKTSTVMDWHIVAHPSKKDMNAIQILMGDRASKPIVVFTTVITKEQCKTKSRRNEAWAMIVEMIEMKGGMARCWSDAVDYHFGETRDAFNYPLTPDESVSEHYKRSDEVYKKMLEEQSKYGK